MNDSSIHTQLHQSGRSELLLQLADTTAVAPDSYTSVRHLAESSGMSELDALYQLAKLSEADLAVQSDRMSGGWRTTPEGTRIAAGLRASLAEGPLRLEHTMRATLANLKAAGDYVTRDDWMDWDLHEEGCQPVAPEERKHALDLLEQLKYTESLNALQGSHIRVRITPLGRTALMQQDVPLTSSLFSHAPTTNIDQQVGLLAHTFNNDGGAVQVGDHAVQNTTITNVRIDRIKEGIAATRAVLAREDLDGAVKDEVSAAMDEFEAATAQQAEPGLLHALLTKATMAAAGTAGSTAGATLIQSLAAIGASLS